MKIKAAILGATGFTGEKIVQLLLKHPDVEIVYLSSRTSEPVSYSEMFPRFQNKINLKCEPIDAEKASKLADVLFLSLPHTISMQSAPLILKNNKKVIDLSADYRFKDTAVYEKYFKTAHSDKNNLADAVYGLCEINRQQIANAKLIANPGCYPTSILLPVYPLLKEKLITDHIIVDSKSSITGAGRKAIIDYHYSNISNNIWAYKPFIHQHIPEVIAVLQEKTANTVNLHFTPQVIGVEAGIYSTIYLTFNRQVTEEEIKTIYSKYYKNCPFVRFPKNLPKLKDVVETNFCDIGFALDETKKFAVIASSIDNLIKGAAGQAVQNMNIMFGLEETKGLL